MLDICKSIFYIEKVSYPNFQSSTPIILIVEGCSHPLWPTIYTKANHLVIKVFCKSCMCLILLIFSWSQIRIRKHHLPDLMHVLNTTSYLLFNGNTWFTKKYAVYSIEWHSIINFQNKFSINMVHENKFSYLLILNSILLTLIRITMRKWILSNLCHWKRYYYYYLSKRLMKYNVFYSVVIFQNILRINSKETFPKFFTCLTKQEKLCLNKI